MESTADASCFSSSASTPVPPSPFRPKFCLRFTNDISKDGDVVSYTIRVIPNDGSFEEHVIQRQYEDFEWLEHCLTTSVDISGIIVPPLPSKPAVTTQMVEVKTKKQFGTCSRELRGDGFFKDSKDMERYLTLLLSHVTFGQDVTLKDFLTKPLAPARTKTKKGILSVISNGVEKWKTSQRDFEEFFQKEKDWVSDYGKQIAFFNKNLNKLIFGQQRLCNSLGNFSTAFTTSICANDESSLSSLSRFIGKFCGGLNDLKQSIEVQIFNDELLLVSTFEFYARYIEAEKEMLTRRTALLIDYENCNKAMDKAKNDKYEIMQNAKKAAEKSFEDCSDVARQEIKRFHQQRSRVMEDTLNVYAESQLKVCCDTYAVLANCLMLLEQLISTCK